MSTRQSANTATTSRDKAKLTREGRAGNVRRHVATRRWAAGVAAGLVVLVAAAAFAQGGGSSMSDNERATMFLDMAQGQHYDYTWHYETDVPAGYYKGNPPHGGVLRTYMNNIAYDAAQAKAGVYPPGSIFVKENHMPVDGMTMPADKNTAIVGFPGNLAAYTIMAKISGYNPEVGDWFFAKLGPDGTIDAAGRVDSCAACHSTVKDNDYVYDAAVK